METIDFYSYILIIGGFLMLVGAFIGLVYSKKDEQEVIHIFQDQTFTLSDRFIQPFRMHQNGEINIILEANNKAKKFESDPQFDDCFISIILFTLLSVSLTSICPAVSNRTSYPPSQSIVIKRWTFF